MHIWPHTYFNRTGSIYLWEYLFLVPEGGDWKKILVLFVLGLIFFSSGLGLLKTTKDRS